MDRIFIRDLLVRCILGVNEAERRERQDVLINLVLDADCRRAADTDDFKDAVDYRAIKKHVIDVVEASQYHLLESLAERVARVCLEHSGVQQVQVTVDKPGALRFAHSVAVEIVRKREES